MVFDDLIMGREYLTISEEDLQCRRFQRNEGCSKIVFKVFLNSPIITKLDSVVIFTNNRSVS